MNSKPKLTKLTIALSVIILLLLIVYLIYLPLRNKWLLMNDKIDSLEIQYMRDQTLLTLGKENTNENILAKFRQSNSDEEEIAVFIKDIEYIFKNSNIIINDIKPLDPEIVDESKKFILRLEMQANIKDLIRFLYAIKEEYCNIKVDKLNIATISRKNNILLIKIYLSKTFIS